MEADGPNSIQRPSNKRAFRTNLMRHVERAASKDWYE